MTDVHHTHHHVVFTGDLNYRLAQTPDQACNGIVECTQRTIHSTGSSASGEDGGAEDDAANNRHWLPLLQHDQLSRCMAGHDVFSGFVEAPISFPPTYRRRKGPVGRCDRLDDMDTVAKVGQCVWRGTARKLYGERRWEVVVLLPRC